MKKAFGMIELLFVLIVIIVIYFTCFHSQYGRSNPFADNVKQIKTKQEVINDKINEIEKAKTLEKQIQKNLDGEY